MGLHEKPQHQVVVEIPPPVCTRYLDRSRKLLSHFAHETQKQLRGETPGSPRLLAFDDTAALLQASAYEIFASLDLQDENDFINLASHIGKRAAIEETMRMRKQEKQRYTGYEDALQKAENTIENAEGALRVMFLPPLDVRTREDEMKAEADTALFLGVLLKQIVNSPQSEVIFT